MATAAPLCRTYHCVYSSWLTLVALAGHLIVLTERVADVDDTAPALEHWLRLLLLSIQQQGYVGVAVCRARGVRHSETTPTSGWSSLSRLALSANPK